MSGSHVEKTGEGGCFIIPLKASVLGVILFLGTVAAQFAYGVSMFSELRSHVNNLQCDVTDLQTDLRNMRALEVKLATVDTRLSGVEREVSTLSRDIRELLTTMKAEQQKQKAGPK